MSESAVLKVMQKPYTDYSDFLKRLFPGVKVQKLSIDAGHNCPNRDGTLGYGGCIYCNNSAFSPAYCHQNGNVAAQIEAGKQFFARKYPKMKYLAYFQAYTSTHAPVKELIKAYEEAMCCAGVCGLVIGTRPDCMPDELLEYLRHVNAHRMPVIVEYGVETLHDVTLELINRHHTAKCAADTVIRTAAAGIHTGIHLIMGLPGESIDMMLETVKTVTAWPIELLKLHQLQIVKGTALHSLWLRQQNNNRESESSFPIINLFTIEEYLELCVRIVRIVPERIAIDRFTAQCPPELLTAPQWGLKNYQFTHLLHARLSVKA